MSCEEFHFSQSSCNNVFIGADFSREIRYKDSGGDPVDLTSSTLYMVIRDINSNVDLLTLGMVGDATTTGFYMPAPTTGVVYLQIREEQVAAFSQGECRYKITRTDASGDEHIFMYGIISFVAAI